MTDQIVHQNGSIVAIHHDIDDGEMRETAAGRESIKADWPADASTNDYEVVGGSLSKR